MIEMIDFTIFDVDGNIIRDGSCPLDDALLQPNLDIGENVIEGKAPDRLAYHVIIPANGARPYLRAMSKEDAAARRAKFTFTRQADPVTVMLELLKVRGQAVSTDELASAKAAASANQNRTQL
jgi:hypothetical protein